MDAVTYWFPDSVSDSQTAAILVFEARKDQIGLRGLQAESTVQVQHTYLLVIFTHQKYSTQSFDSLYLTTSNNIC